MHAATEYDCSHGFAARPRKARCPLVLALLAAALTFPMSGCALLTGVQNYLTYNDNQNDFIMGFRNGVWARQAWAERRHEFAGQPYLGAFGSGFQAGYASVAAGGDGCPPPIAPRKFWTWKYQNPEGQAKVAAWFSGFPYGAQAAEEDQAGEFQEIQVSYAIEHQYSPEFTNSQVPGVSPQTQPSGQAPLEPLPNPGFGPAELPLDDSASRGLPAGPFDVRQVGHQGMGVPSGVSPASFQQPQPMIAWPR